MTAYNVPPQAVTAAEAIAPPSGSSSTSSTPAGFNEGLAIFVTFVILILMSVWSVTNKFAVWVGIALLALVWTAAFRTKQAQSFWNTFATAMTTPTDVSTSSTASYSTNPLDPSYWAWPSNQNFLQWLYND